MEVTGFLLCVSVPPSNPGLSMPLRYSAVRVWSAGASVCVIFTEGRRKVLSTVTNRDKVQKKINHGCRGGLCFACHQQDKKSSHLELLHPAASALLPAALTPPLLRTAGAPPALTPPTSLHSWRSSSPLCFCEGLLPRSLHALPANVKPSECFPGTQLITLPFSWRPLATRCGPDLLLQVS